MDEFDYWRLCDDLSIFQAALLVIGEDPSGDNSYIEGWEVHKRPHGYEAAKTAIANGLMRSVIEGELKFELKYDLNGNEVGGTNVIDALSSIVSVESLRKFLTARGITTGFFFPSGFDNRSYLDRDNSCYAPKLATALARAMVSRWGMSESVGPIDLRESDEHPFLGREIAQPRRFSETTAHEVDEAVGKILREAEARDVELVRAHRLSLDCLVTALEERETLDAAQIETYLGAAKHRPAPPRSDDETRSKSKAETG